MHYTIRHINSWSALKFGAIIGAAVGALPGLLLGISFWRAVNGLRHWLESWLVIDLSLLGTFSILQILALEDFLAWLQRVDDQGFLLALLCMALIMALSSFLMALSMTVGTIVYNVTAQLSGGLIIEAQALQRHPAGQRPSTQQPPNPPLSSPMESTNEGGWLVSTTTGQRWPVPYGRTRIGSSPANQMVLADVAANHAEIEWQNGRFILQDYSGGQTWVNGRALTGPHMIKNGFQIQLANETFTFQFSNHSQAFSK